LGLQKEFIVEEIFFKNRKGDVEEAEGFCDDETEDGISSPAPAGPSCAAKMVGSEAGWWPSTEYECTMPILTLQTSCNCMAIF
jgi:hypothetical protein